MLLFNNLYQNQYLNTDLVITCKMFTSNHSGKSQRLHINHCFIHYGSNYASFSNM